MKKKIIGGLAVLLVIVFGVAYVLNSKSHEYAYVDELVEENGYITFRIFGSSNRQYAGYDLISQEDGEYVFELYGKMFFGELYPIKIEIDNQDKEIKKIIQKGIESDEYEVIYDSTTD